MTTRGISSPDVEFDETVLLQEAIKYCREILSSKSTHSESPQPSGSGSMMATTPQNISLHSKKPCIVSQYIVTTDEAKKTTGPLAGRLTTQQSSTRKRKDEAKAKLEVKGDQRPEGEPNPKERKAETDPNSNLFDPCQDYVLRKVVHENFDATTEILAKMMHQYCFPQKSLISLFERVEFHKYDTAQQNPIDLEREIENLESQLKEKAKKVPYMQTTSTKIARTDDAAWTRQNLINVHSIVDSYPFWPPSAIAKCFVRNGHLKKHSLQAIWLKAEERRTENILKARSEAPGSSKYSFSLFPNFKWTGDARLSFISL